MQKNEKNKFLCPLPWIQLCIHTNGSQKVCCHTNMPHSIANTENKPSHFNNDKDMLDPLNNPGLVEIRKKMLNGEIPEMCISCANEEKSTGQSPRMEMLGKFAEGFEKSLSTTKENGHIDNPKIHYLDISVGNECNLACRMCNPYYSSKIEQEWRENKIDFPWDKVEEAKAFSRSSKIMKESLKDVELICFQGGEPLINKSHIEMLEKLVNAGKAHSIKIEYNTNLSILPKQILDLWKNFKEVKLFVSLDGVGGLQELIRRPLVWKKFISNLETARKNSFIEIIFVTVVQVYNFPFLPEIIEFVSSFNQKKTMPDLIFLQSPHYLTPEALDSDLLSRSIEKLNQYISQNQLEKDAKGLLHYISQLKPNGGKKILFKVYNDKIEAKEKLKWNEFVNKNF